LFFLPELLSVRFAKPPFSLREFGSCLAIYCDILIVKCVMGGEVRMRIAIVDDERQDCATLSEMLAERLSQTAFIDVYDSGNHFLDSEVHYDLVFLDIVMDGLDGIETARRLREWDMGCLLVF